ncbi:hypothetical protein AB1K70_04375 [Bremerella sp. JC770]|uniref:hypothetical protein n=1 Tax=Bremerella sp. JC770 TaxID=3232137 RepID=UPI0034598FAB
MKFPTRYRLAVTTLGALLLGLAGCGFSPVAAVPDSTSQSPSTTTVAGDLASTQAVVPTETAKDKSAPAANTSLAPKTNRNPFRPPTVQARTVSPQQAQSADIRLLGIAKRDSQHIALLETAGDFHKAIVGDFIDEWEVLTVTETETTLRRGLEQLSLRIR